MLYVIPGIDGSFLSSRFTSGDGLMSRMSFSFRAFSRWRAPDRSRSSARTGSEGPLAARLSASGAHPGGQGRERSDRSSRDVDSVCSLFDLRDVQTLAAELQPMHQWHSCSDALGRTVDSVRHVVQHNTTR